MVAASTAVARPMMATTVCEMGASVYRMLLRAIIYIPAVTMVAAWIKAETGVGPAIASGSQVYRGICADFPEAPTNNNKVMPVNTVADVPGAALKTVLKSVEPNCAIIQNTASKNPRSPI